MIVVSKLNEACESFTTADKLSLHSAAPGTSGANQTDDTPQTITWTIPTSGQMTAVVSFANVIGEITHVGFWQGATFVGWEECSAKFYKPSTLTVGLLHKVSAP